MKNTSKLRVNTYDKRYKSARVHADTHNKIKKLAANLEVPISYFLTALYDSADQEKLAQWAKEYNDEVEALKDFKKIS